MGIRIHKSIGYALTDVVYDDEEWSVKNDGRFNPDGWMMLDYDEREERYTIAGFKEYIEAKLPADKQDYNHDSLDLIILKQMIDAGKVKEIYNYIIYDMEFGMPNVMQIIPPGNNDWLRYDNIIDYYDPTNRESDGGIESSIIEIDRPIWPYESYLNTTKYPPSILTGFQQQLYVIIKNYGLDQHSELEDAFKELGISSKEEFENNIIPIIPPIVVELLKYVNMFKDEKTIYELRPIIYGYWA